MTKETGLNGAAFKGVFKGVPNSNFSDVRQHALYVSSGPICLPTIYRMEWWKSHVATLPEGQFWKKKGSKNPLPWTLTDIQDIWLQTHPEKTDV